MKVGRQTKIVELIQTREIETQEELGDLLMQEGYQVTQATISRDIRELKLTKIPAENGRQKYAIMQSQEAGMNRKYVRVLQECFVSMDKAENILVIKTASGMAMAVAAAVDALDIPGVVGSIAGDDTIMCAIRTSGEVEQAMERISRLLRAELDLNRDWTK